MELSNIEESIVKKRQERRLRLTQVVPTSEKDYSSEDIAMIMKRLSKYDLLLVKDYLPRLCHVEFIGPEARNYGNDDNVMKKCINYHYQQEKQTKAWLNKLSVELLQIEKIVLSKKEILPDFLELNEENADYHLYRQALDKLANIIEEVAIGNGYVSALTYEEFVAKYRAKIKENETNIRLELESPIFYQVAQIQMKFLCVEEKRYQNAYCEDWSKRAYEQYSLNTDEQEETEFHEEMQVRV